MLRELCEIVSLRREGTWNIISLAMKWKPFLEKELVLRLKKRKAG